MPPWVPPIPTTHQRIKLNIPIGCRIYATATRPNPEAPHELQTLLFTNEGVRPLSGLSQNATSESLRLGDALPLRERSGWGDSRPSSFRGPSRLSGRDRTLDRTSALYDQKGIVTCAACDPASGTVYFSDGTAILQLDMEGVVSLVAGSTELMPLEQGPDRSGHVDGPGGAARFVSVDAMAVGQGGQLFVIDSTLDDDSTRLRCIQLPQPTVSAAGVAAAAAAAGGGGAGVDGGCGLAEGEAEEEEEEEVQSAWGGGEQGGGGDGGWFGGLGLEGTGEGGGEGEGGGGGGGREVRRRVPTVTTLITALPPYWSGARGALTSVVYCWRTKRLYVSTKGAVFVLVEAPERQQGWRLVPALAAEEGQSVGEVVVDDEGDLYIAGLSASSAPISRRLWRIRNIPPPDMLLQQQQHQQQPQPQGQPDPQAGSGSGLGLGERSSAPAAAATSNSLWARPSTSGNSNRTSMSGIGTATAGGANGGGYGFRSARSSADGALGGGGRGAGGGEAGAVVPMTRAEVTVLAVGTHLFRWMQIGAYGWLLLYSPIAPDIVLIQLGVSLPGPHSFLYRDAPAPGSRMAADFSALLPLPAATYQPASSSAHSHHNHHYSLQQPPIPTDVVVTVGERGFQCHRLVLSARCPYFRPLLFTSSFRDSSDTHVSLPDASPHVFEMLLRYMYTDDTRFPRACLRHVAELADRLLMTAAAEAAQRQLLAAVTPATVVYDMLWAERMGFGALVAALKSYYVARQGQVLVAAPRSVRRLLSEGSMGLVMEVYERTVRSSSAYW